MKKFFITFTMMLLGLFAGVSTMWAVHVPEAQGGYTPEQAVTYGFWAKLTAKPAASTNGSGKVFVVANYNYSEDPEAGDYAIQKSDEDWSDIYLASSLVNADVEFKAYAKADNGSYFTGWSFTDGYTDLGVGSGTYAAIKVNPSPQKGKTNILDYAVYAAFEQVKLKSYEVSGDNTMDSSNPTCTQTVTFRAETPGFSALNSADDVKHFKLPVITPKAGTAGTWATSITEWNTSNIEFHGDYALIKVPVTFTAPNGNAAEYGAELVLETEAGVKMKVYLSARTTGGEGQAVRYDKDGVEVDRGDLTDMIAAAAATDVVKLNGNYAEPVTIGKNLTFDLNGYNLSNTLTVSGGNVTIGYSAFGGTANALNVTGGKAILNGGTFGTLTIGANATVEQNGATITGAATNNGTLTTTDGIFRGALTSSKSLIANGGTFNNTSGVAITVTGGTAQIMRGTIYGNSYGVLTNGGSATIEKLAVISGRTRALNNVSGTLTVNNGKFPNSSKFAIGEITFKSAYFGEDAADIASTYEKQQWRNTAGPEFRDGYLYFVGDQDAAQTSNVSVCRIGKTSYASLEEALAYANNSGKDVFIIMENDYVLPAGYYTLPANATLIVPMSNDQETANPIVPRETSGTPTPVSFRKLTFADGVNMSVLGTIELTCTQHGSGETMGIPGGNYGHLILKPGSRMTINNGGELRAWGFVTGDGTKDSEGNYLSGEIDARRGAIVREMFQMGDWKGGDISLTMVIPKDPYLQYQQKTHLFPVYTYFIQNVESPVKYHPGASLICATSVNVSGSINAYANDIKVVGKEGEAAMFLMDEMADAENTWVRKYYDAKNDQQVYEVNSGAKLGSVVIDLGEVPGAMFGGGTGTYNIQLDSRKFILPLTSNFKIHLLSGYMEFTQSTSCLPGMEVEVDKESEVAIVKNDDDDIVSGALYFYDADQWSYNGSKGYVGNSGKFGAIVRYSATWDLGTNGVTKHPNVRDISSPSKIGDAILNVHGTFRMGENCAVYTTWKKDNTLVALDESEGATGGASIISTNEDAGTFIFDADAPTYNGIVLDESGNFVSVGQNCLVNYDHNDYGQANYPVHQTTILSSNPPLYSWELCTSAKLQNGDGTFAETEGTAAGKSYCYMNDRWTLMEVAEENDCFMKDNYGTFYAKPAEYVAVNATYDEGEGMLGNGDHTFSDLDGAGRLFILMDGCQWWEVEKKDNLYHCIHPNNDTYYYWDETKGKWMEQRFTITWKNWDGTPIETVIDELGTTGSEYSVTYGTMAEFLGSNPTREPNIDYTYDFTGWAPALGKVTSNVTYTATYSEQPRKYTIVFTTEGGAEIERHFLTHNELPVCENVPTRTGHTLQWEPAMAAVTGDATYRATWLPEPPTAYEIRFVDYDGYELQVGDVNVGEQPAYEGADPTRKNTNVASREFSYIFDHWAPDFEEVTRAMTYTAVYREEAKEYTVIFKDEYGSDIETRTYHYGETPVCTNQPTKENTAEFTYQLVWDPQIQAIVGNLDPEEPIVYTADFLETINKYSVSIKSNPSGACLIYGNGVYEYDEAEDALIVAVVKNEGYNFVGWSDGAEIEEDPEYPGAYIRSLAITADINLVANFECPDCDKVNIVWKNWDDSELTIVSQAKGTATTYPGATPTKPATSAETYTFDGWSIEQGGDRVYKNGMTPKAAEGGATYYAHFTATPIPSLEVASGETMVLSAPVEYQNLILTSDGIHSGQLLGQNYLTLTGNAYFDYAVNAKARLWYQVAVPWQVDARTGISVNGRTLVLGKDFDVIYYDGYTRAASHVNKAWTYVEDEDNMMYPGQLYMISILSDAPVIRFVKADGASLLTTHTSVTQYNSDVEGDKGWNGVSNPALFHAYVNSGVEEGQVYIPGEDRYKPMSMSSAKMVVGQGAYVQVDEGKPIDVSYGGLYNAGAPRRMAAESVNTKFEVRIAPINKEETDLVFILTDDSKNPDAYTVGKDLAKMGVSTQVAQMWVNRYNMQLCKNTMSPIDGQADYPLGIFAPEDGQYSISILRTGVEQPSDLYLTLDGEIIWNLSKNAYTLQLEQGTTARYGLRTVSEAPQVTTDIEPIWVDPEGNAIKAAKILINNHVYILRDGKLYTITGSLVR